MDTNIDVVYTYVNFRDENWKHTYISYSNSKKKSRRYYSFNELELSIKYTLKHCKFISSYIYPEEGEITKLCKLILNKL